VLTFSAAIPLACSFCHHAWGEFSLLLSTPLYLVCRYQSEPHQAGSRGVGVVVVDGWMMGVAR